MANNLPVMTRKSLDDNGIKVAEYTSLYAVKSSIELDSFKESKWDIIGVDPIEKVYYVKRVS